MKPSLPQCLIICAIISVGCLLSCKKDLKFEPNAPETVYQDFIVAGQTSDAHYCDVQPDDTCDCDELVLFCADTFSVDINGDGLTDFEILYSSFYDYWQETHYLGTGIYCLNGAQVVVDSTLLPVVLESGDSISESSNWSNNNPLGLAWLSINDLNFPPNTIAEGPWLHEDSKFLGARIITQEDTIYSWLRLSVFYYGGYITHDYAYR